MKFPIFFDGDIPVQDVADALASRGIHLVADGGGWTARHVPAFLRKEPATNVVQMKTRRKAAK